MENEKEEPIIPNNAATMVHDGKMCWIDLQKLEKMKEWTKEKKELVDHKLEFITISCSGKDQQVRLTKEICWKLDVASLTKLKANVKAFNDKTGDCYVLAWARSYSILFLVKFW